MPYAFRGRGRGVHERARARAERVARKISTARRVRPISTTRARASADLEHAVSRGGRTSDARGMYEYDEYDMLHDEYDTHTTHAYDTRIRHTHTTTMMYAR